MISGGPSRHHLKPEHFLDGPRVAINRAIDLRAQMHIDIWALWDHPSTLFGVGCDKYVYPPLTVWLGANRFFEMFLSAAGRIKRTPWEGLFHHAIGFRCLDRGLLNDPIAKSLRAGFSLIYVLEKCVSLGAEHIRVLGCDMAGGWHTFQGLSEEESVKRENWDRWKYERIKIQEFVDAAKKRKIKVEIFAPERVLPPVAVGGGSVGSPEGAQPSGGRVAPEVPPPKRTGGKKMAK